MKSTRQRLLEYLGTHLAATAREISHALQVTAADARHHLSILLQEGAIVPVGIVSGSGRGRPAMRYSLVAHARPVPYDLLASALLVEALDRLSDPARESFLRGAMVRLVGEPTPRGSLTARLVGTIQRLKEWGYPARWEAHAAGPHLILERRPFEELAAKHTEAGDLDMYLLEALLGASVRRKDGGSVYVVGKTQ